LCDDEIRQANAQEVRQEGEISVRDVSHSLGDRRVMLDPRGRGRSDQPTAENGRCRGQPMAMFFITGKRLRWAKWGLSREKWRSQGENGVKRSPS
jgi:hypothetical protein